MITIEELNKCGVNNNRASKYINFLNEYMPQFGINTPLRVAHYMCQILHESGSFKYDTEIASGAAYDTGKLAVKLGNTPSKDGDGQKYKGRGLIQLTGRTNYSNFNSWLNKTFEWFRKSPTNVYKNPELVATPRFAVLSSIYFWTSKGLNALADKDEFTKITKIINGGTNGIDNRLKLLGICKKVFR